MKGAVRPRSAGGHRGAGRRHGDLGAARRALGQPGHRRAGHLRHLGTRLAVPRHHQRADGGRCGPCGRPRPCWRNGPAPSGPGRCYWPVRGRFAPASSGPSRRWSRPSTASARRSTSAARSCTTGTWWRSSRPAARCSCTSSTRYPTAPRWCSPPTAWRPSVRAEAAARGLQVVDATCPLVAKVHHEVHRFHRRGYQVVLIGHAGHDETEGTLGEGGGITLVENADDVAALEVADPERLAYVTQTTLSPDDVSGLVAVLSERFPAIVGPHAADVCYATQNRQDAVQAIAADCDLMLVIGSPNSSNTVRLAEVAARAGCRAELIDDETGLRAWMAARRRDRRSYGGCLRPAVPGRAGGRHPGRPRAHPDRRAARARRTRSFFPAPGGPITNGCPPASEHQDRHLSGSPEAGRPRQVPAHRRARTAVRLQPLLQRLRQDPVSDRDPAPTADRRAGGGGHRGVAGADGLDRRRRATAAPGYRPHDQRAARPGPVRLPVHQRPAAGAQAGPVHSSPAVQLGGAHRRPAGAP